MARRSAVLLALAVSACGPVEVRIDETKGVPAVKGQTEVSISTTFTCGTALPAGDKMVATRVVSGGCEFTFDDTIEVLKASDYQDIGELKTAANLVQRVELTVKKLAFVDAATGTALDLSTRVTSVVLSVNGQQVADKTALSNLPKVVKLEGAALTDLKAKVDARQPASVAVRAVAVLPDMPRPPERLKIDYEAQPAIILGPGEVKVF
jgi:hypothetical protein